MPDKIVEIKIPTAAQATSKPQGTAAQPSKPDLWRLVANATGCSKAEALRAVARLDAEGLARVEAALKQPDKAFAVLHALAEKPKEAAPAK